MQLLRLFAEIWAALSQAGVLLGAGLFVGLGTWLCGNRLYWRLRAKAVKGTAVGVRAPGKHLDGVAEYAAHLGHAGGYCRFRGLPVAQDPAPRGEAPFALSACISSG